MRRELVRLRGREFEAGALLDFGARPVHAAFSDDIFQARMFAVGTVAVIAVNCQDGLRNVHEFVGREEAEDIREARESLLISVAAAHTAADGEIVAGEFVVFDNRNEADVVRENVQVVHRWNDEGYFEFARQVCFAIKRVHEVFVCRVVQIELHAVNPDCVIRLCLRRERERDPFAIGINLLARLGVGGRRRREDVAVHIAAGGESGKQ